MTTPGSMAMLLSHPGVVLANSRKMTEIVLCPSAEHLSCGQRRWCGFTSSDQVCNQKLGLGRRQGNTLHGTRSVLGQNKQNQGKLLNISQHKHVQPYWRGKTVILSELGERTEA